jgi:hypothetical protein
LDTNTLVINCRGSGVAAADIVQNSSIIKATQMS